VVEPRIHALNQLKCLRPSQFDEVIFHYGVDESQLSMNGTQAQRAIDVIKLASQQEGQSLCRLLDLIAQIAAHSKPKKRIVLAQSLPLHYVERAQVGQEIKQHLFWEVTARAGTSVIIAIYGLGGVGKSTLAAALAHAPEVQSYFPDGIFWATLGQQPDILSFLSAWIQALGDYDFKPINSDAASLQLRTLLSDKKALLVVDDVWNPEHVKPFLVASGGCRVLVTTREKSTVPPGAIRYELKVMTSEQSLELLTSCLNQELTKAELELAATLAKTVGYLPLALELAAAQVSDEIPWDELLRDLQAEIANLETLDRWEAEDASSEAQRKNNSLVASFNLSLKRLSPERLKCFTWLGVLPDDVTITENLAATLWECSSIQGRKLLRHLRQKALLLSSTQETNYRLHDLLHDLARNLLQSPTTPEKAFQLPGLGLSIPEAHQQLLARYRQQTTNGLWHTLTDDGYIYSRLIWHLEKAQKIEEIHQLLQEETPEGYNGWYWQCDQQGKTANFVKDISRAWAIAEANLTANRTESISLQCRYALIFTSLNSLADNISPELMAALLEKEIWKPAQALAYVRQNKHSYSQAKGLEKIIKYLPSSSLSPEVLDAAIAIGDERNRARALVGLAPHLSQSLLSEALDAARAIGDELHRARVLVGLAPHLPQSLLSEALDATRAIGDELNRAQTLVELAPHLPEVLPKALDAARAIGDEFNRAKALVELAPHLPEVLPEALDAARAIGDEFNRAKALMGLTPHSPEVLPEALDAARAIEDEFYRAIALQLAPHLPEVLLEALDAARAIGNEFYRAIALQGLASHLPKVLPEALEAARAIRNESNRAIALQGLATYLPEVLSEALDTARAIGDEFNRAIALVELAPHLPEVLPEALDAARAIRNERYRADALQKLAPHLPEVLPEALDAARNIGDENYLAIALQELAPHLPEALPEALEAARAIRNESNRAIALVGLATHLPEALPEALEAARAIRNESNRAIALLGLATHLPEVLPEALDAARAIEDEFNRAYTLQQLAPHLPEVLPEALEAARAIGDESNRAYTLQQLAPYLPEVLPEALDAARNIGDEYYRAYTLQQLAPHLPEVLPEALEAARAIKDELHRVKALQGLAPYLPEVLSEALEAARTIGDEYHRVKALKGLAPYLPEVLPEALEAARNIGDEANRAIALQELAPNLPQSLLPEALEAVGAIGDESNRLVALQDFIERLTPLSIDDPLWQKILHTLAILTRPNFLEALPHLAPLIIKFGGVKALRETVKAVKDVSRWWK